MFRIDNATAAATQPAPTAAGTPGYFTDGSPGGGVPATVVPAEWLNAVQEELINAVTAAGLTPSKTVFNQLASAIAATTPGRRVAGLRGNQNAATPLTKMDIAADLVISVDASGLATKEVAIPVGTLDFGLAGPIANGRDQAAAFAASTWINVFRIFNPTTGAGAWIASTGAATTGPVLPAGYTRWAYATTLRWNASSNLIPSFIEGNTIVYDLVDNGVNRVISSGSSTTMTTVDCSAYVPPNALRANFIANLTVSGGVAVVNAFVRRTGSTHTGQNIASASVQVASQTITAVNWADIPLNAQKFDYRLSIAPSTGGFSAEVRGYVVPNGDC